MGLFSGYRHGFFMKTREVLNKVENARILDERLRKIISEISGRTGTEIKKNLLGDLGECFQTAIEEHARKETTRLLELLKKTIEKM
jgi:hypothetical protein